MKFFEFINNQQDIVSTNYWQSSHAGQGYAYLSLNAGAVRLLIPDMLEDQIPDMTNNVELVIITEGKLKSKDAVELLFEDHTDNPYVLHMQTAQMDRSFSSADRNKSFPLTIWTKGGKQAKLTAKYRQAKRLPYLKPWGE